MDAVAAAAGELFDESGFEGVSVEAVAKRLEVSRATLYRTIGTREALLDTVFERSTHSLQRAIDAVIAEKSGTRSTLERLIRAHLGAAVTGRRYINLFFGGSQLAPDTFQRWQQWTHDYEVQWSKQVAAAIEDGVLPPGDPLVTTRLVLGMVNWVARWYRPAGAFSSEQIAQAAVDLVLRG